MLSNATDDAQAQMDLLMEDKHAAAKLAIYKAKRALGWTVERAKHYALTAFE